MDHKKNNIFIISTPSQMMNAMEIIHHLNLLDEQNTIVITCNSEKFILQIKQIGNAFSLVYHIIFSPKLTIVPSHSFNRIPLKLVRLYVSKKRISRLLKRKPVDYLILGNYSNFLSQYATQQIKTETFVLDDGTGTILVAKKRVKEIKDGVPIFDFNFKKKALWMVKLLLGFYKYKIPQKLTFFSSYKIDISGEDKYIENEYSYLKSSYSSQNIDSKLVYFIGSPISEVGYVTEAVEIEMILKYANHLKDKRLLYIPHRLDSKQKISHIKTVVDILPFDLPIEFALTQNGVLPNIMCGFFTSALPNLLKLMNGNVLFFALKIPKSYFLTENMKNRAKQVYDTYEKINGIKIIDSKSHG